MKKTTPSVATNATIRKACPENKFPAFLFNRVSDIDLQEGALL